MNMLKTRQGWPHVGLVAAGLAFATMGNAQVHVPTPVEWGGEFSAKESWASFSAGLYDVDGSSATFQRRRQHHRDGFYGLDEFRYRRMVATDRLMTVEGHGLAKDGEYRVRMRIENTATGSYLEAGVRQSRVFYDGNGGYFPINDQWFSLFDPHLEVDRSEIWLGGLHVSGAWKLRLRYSHHERDGMKDSTSWGDTNLTGLTGSTAARYIVPSFYTLDEKRDIITVDLEHGGATTTLGGGLRWENIETDDARHVRRRPGETATDRFLTQREGNDSDLFSMHAFAETRRGENLILSAAASHTKIDTNFTGSRIFGGTFDAEFDALFPRRQSRDEGFFDLEGDSNWKQTLLTANALYLPAKNWRIEAGLRFENQEQDAVADFLETVVGTTSALVTAIEELESDSSRDFDEIMGSVKATYTGVANWVWTVFAEAATGDGDLREELIEPELDITDIARSTAFDRDYTKFGANARWYPSTQLNFAAGVYRKIRENDYTTADDTTPNNGADRYPAYIDWQRFTTDDLYVRGSWRPARTVALVSRYDYQETDIDSREDGLAGVLSAELKAHIISGTVSWNPLARLSMQGTINYVYNRIETGSAKSTLDVARQAGHFDNNYRTASLLVLYALNETTDVQVDGALFQSGNYHDVAEYSVPYGLTARERAAGVTVTHRVSEDMVVSLRYAYNKYTEPSSGGNRDYDANLIYGRVQLRY